LDYNGTQFYAPLSPSVAHNKKLRITHTAEHAVIKEYSQQLFVCFLLSQGTAEEQLDPCKQLQNYANTMTCSPAVPGAVTESRTSH